MVFFLLQSSLIYEMGCYPAGALRRRLLHRNGTFVPPAPTTRTRWRVKTDFLRKTGRSGPFFHQSGRFQGVERAKFRCRRSHLFGFSRRWPESGRFGRFSGPRGPKWRIHLLTLTQKERRGGRPECCLLYTSPSPRDRTRSRMPSSA